MKYISIDGDDIGQLIHSCYLNNDIHALREVNALVQSKVRDIADFLRNEGFSIIFCAADGVACSALDYIHSEVHLFRKVSEIAGTRLTFSVGIGTTLRESYIASLAAKSNGKAKIFNYKDLN
jgi:hypothetical protein